MDTCPTPLIRDTAQWLIELLQDEVPLPDPVGTRAKLMVWLGGFRYMNSHLSRQPNHYLLRVASREADRFFQGHMQQSWHNWRDKAYFLGTLSRGLLLACGCFERPMDLANPNDLLRSESLHSGHYACLYSGVTEMFFGMGIPDRSYQPDSVFVVLNDPFLSPN